MHLKPLSSLCAFICILVGASLRGGEPVSSSAYVQLKPEAFASHISRFNAMEDENIVNLVPNKDSWAWLQGRIPLFECSASEVEEIYYYRWWALRKHLKKDEAGRLVFTEFLTKPKTVSSALGHHVMELRWLRDTQPLEDYVLHWLRGNEGKPQAHLHRFSGWLAAALYQRSLVQGDSRFEQGLLDDLVADYETWVKERGTAQGLFWQYDVRDAMEESISGSRTKMNLRPPLNSYQFGNARAIAAIAKAAGRSDLEKDFSTRAEKLRELTLASLWDPHAKFFKVRLEEGALADVREELGYIPWYFELPPSGKGYEEAWLQIKDPSGFKAPYGLTTAERRHPRFRSHGVGTCEWDGAVWPFATSQTLTGLANVLNGAPQPHVTAEDYFDAFLTYVRSHRYYGLPYIGEYHDEQTGQWLKWRQERSRYYNHSTFADLLFTGLLGLRPSADGLVHINPLLPKATWDWFCVDGIRYHGHDLCLLWDLRGERYGRGKGLILLIDGSEAARREDLGPLSAPLPEAKH